MDWTTWRTKAKQHKKDEKLSDADIASAVGGVERGAVNHWLNGRNDPTLSQFFALCEVIKADPKELLFDEDTGDNAPETESDLSPEELKIVQWFRLLKKSKKAEALSRAQALLEGAAYPLRKRKAA